MEHANLELLQHGLSELGLALDDDRLARLVDYHDFLHKYNQNVNLTGLRNERESVTGNLLNALAPWRSVKPELATADVGAGGGLPGLPLAIALNIPSMALIESKKKKCDFLRKSVKQFAPNVRVVESDVNIVTEKFDQIVSVAYGSLAKLLNTTTKMRRKKHRRVLAWKGRLERIHDEIDACEPSQNAWQIKPFTVPGLNAERHLCIFE